MAFGGLYGVVVQHHCHGTQFAPSLLTMSLTERYT